VLVDLNMRTFDLSHALHNATLDYAEAVVCPFAPRALGAMRPDDVSATSPATDKLQGVLPLVNLVAGAFGSAPVQAVWPGVTMIGVCVFLLPRSSQAGFFDARSSTTVSPGTVVIDPLINVKTINSTFGSVQDDQFGPAYAYTIGVTYLGSNGLYYGYSPPASNEPITLFRGYNSILTTRIGLVAENFNSLRILGNGIKIWSNAPPINTGGYTWGGEIAMQDLYRAFTGDITSNTIQDSLKHRTQYSGLDGVTLRYNSIVEQQQLRLNEVYLTDVKRVSQTIVYDGDGDDFEAGIDGYSAPPESQWQSKDLATVSTLVPCAVWQFSDTNSLYDLSFNSIFHLEGRTVGVCPFENSTEVVDPNIEHLDKFLRHHAFPISAKGHSFKTFIEKARKITGKITAGATRAAMITQLLEKFLASIPMV
jgi:hypothetical protein